MTNPAVPNRDRQHGGLEAVGIVSQRMKESMREGVNWENDSLHPAARESLDMIAHKIARVLSGSNPHDFQHWEDIEREEEEEEMVDSTPLQTRQGPPITFGEEVAASMQAAIRRQKGPGGLLA